MTAKPQLRASQKCFLVKARKPSLFATAGNEKKKKKKKTHPKHRETKSSLKK